MLHPIRGSPYTASAATDEAMHTQLHTHGEHSILPAAHLVSAHTVAHGGHSILPAAAAAQRYATLCYSVSRSAQVRAPVDAHTQRINHTPRCMDTCGRCFYSSSYNSSNTSTALSTTTHTHTHTHHCTLLIAAGICFQLSVRPYAPAAGTECNHTNSSNSNSFSSSSRSSSSNNQCTTGLPPQCLLVPRVNT